MDNVNGDGEAAVQRQPVEMFPVETRTAKNLFIVGFFFLPFVWLLNYGINRSLLKNPDTPQKLRTYTTLSLIFFWVFMAIWMAWIVIYYLNYGSDFADTFSLFRITRWSFMGHDMK